MPLVVPLAHSLSISVVIAIFSSIIIIVMMLAMAVPVCEGDASAERQD
jgi:hypothetical protein